MEKQPKTCDSLGRNANVPGLDEAFTAAGAVAWGAVAYESLLPCMSAETQQTTKELCANPTTVLIAAFPYYAGNRPGNVSLYSRGVDYHIALIDRLKTVCDFLKGIYPDNTFVPATDDSPLPEREAARQAGLGMVGRHGLIILPTYGSFVFLGTVLTDVALDIEPRTPAPNCPDCGRCVSACPGGALRGKTFDEMRCVSNLTQTKGELTPEEKKMVVKHPLIWGCDICQQVCPFNDKAPISRLPEFTEDLKDVLTEEDLEGLTNKTFQEKFGHRAWAWLGPGILRRNLEWKREQEQN